MFMQGSGESRGTNPFTDGNHWESRMSGSAYGRLAKERTATAHRAGSYLIKSSASCSCRKCLCPIWVCFSKKKIKKKFHSKMLRSEQKECCFLIVCGPLELVCFYSFPCTCLHIYTQQLRRCCVSQRRWREEREAERRWIERERGGKRY